MDGWVSQRVRVAAPPRGMVSSTPVHVLLAALAIAVLAAAVVVLRRTRTYSLPSLRRWPRRVLYLLGGRRLPRTVGQADVPGLSDAAEIGRDLYHVPYIRAECEEDAWAALGFAQAQDRAFQLELILRICRGTLAELVGKDGLAIDKLSRRLGFRRIAPRVGVDRTDQVRNARAYAAGINAGLAASPRPHEFVLLGLDRSTTWTENDVWAVYPFLCFCLASNWDMELLRLKILALDGADALRKVDFAYADAMPAATPVPGAPSSLKHVDLLAHDLAAFFDAIGIEPGSSGSNAWAVDGSRTLSGRPILANDPHLMPDVPSSLYMCRMSWPGTTVCGVAWLGAPMFLTGHNGHLAFGITAAHADNVDLFLEHVDVERGRVMELRHGEKHWLPCEVYDEEIRVKGQAEPVIERVIVTSRGPILSPALHSDPLHAADDAYGNAVSICASYLKQDAQAANGGMCLAHRARTHAEFLAGYKSLDGTRDLNHCATSANILAQASDGSIAYTLRTRVPRRTAGAGMLPMPGWRPDLHAWRNGMVPLDELPWLENPPGGIVATCNQAPQDASQSDSVYLGADWLDGYRFRRVLNVLRMRRSWTVASMTALQLDTVTSVWRDVKEALCTIDISGAVDEADADHCRRVLYQWDGNVAADSAAATLWQLTVHETLRVVAETLAPKSSAWVLGRGFTALLPFSLQHSRAVSQFAQFVLLQDNSVWHGHPGVTWSSVLTTALATAWRTANARFGSDQRAWQWGLVRPLWFKHVLASASAVLHAVFSVGPLPGGGDSTTLAQAAVNPCDALGAMGCVAQARVVIDVGGWDNSRFVIAPGQSGNPLSPHYDDLLPAWASGRGIEIPFTDNKANARIRNVLSLQPPTS